MNMKSNLAGLSGNPSIGGIFAQNNSIAGFGPSVISTPFIGLGLGQGSLQAAGFSNLSSESYSVNKDISKLDPHI